MAEAADLTSTVARHYNEHNEGGLEQRVLSRIFYLRNFNNWIKSMAIADALTKLRQKLGSGKVCVLDLCSGKGGDLLKWKKGRVDHVVFADIASTSVEQCEARFKEMMVRNNRERFPEKIFTAEYYAADCTKVNLKDVFRNPDILFDLVSCQFALHYSFESYQQAHVMLSNVSDCLKPGGLFIGTIPDSNELVKRLRNSDSNSFGNEVYKIAFQSEDKTNLPLFGCRYEFFLEGVVDCPEFLVYFPLLEQLAKEHGLRLVKKRSFSQAFSDMISQSDGRALIGKMQGLEPYPADEDIELMCKDEAAYKIARAAVAGMKAEQADASDHRKRSVKVGTLSAPEWEAANVYLCFMFEKVDSSDIDSGDTATTTSDTSNRTGSLKRHFEDAGDNKEAKIPHLSS